jgi:hypothetical protein
VKESAGKIFRDKKLETEGKPTKLPARCKSSRRIEGCGVRKIGQHRQQRLPMELILIIVLLLLLFGGGGGYFGRSRGYW